MASNGESISMVHLEGNSIHSRHASSIYVRYSPPKCHHQVHIAPDRLQEHPSKMNLFYKRKSINRTVNNSVVLRYVSTASAQLSMTIITLLII